MDTYKTIRKQSEGIYREKGSKFIGLAFPVKTEADCKEIIARLKKEHHGANHHCYAYRLGADMQNSRANDDGEPNNTAGKPILGQIQSKGITNVLIVVVRYFGGTLLGVSGLITAYKSAAAQALENVEITEKHICFLYKAEFNFEQMNDVMRVMKENNCTITLQDYTDHNILHFYVRKSVSEQTENSLKNHKGILLTFIGLAQND